MNKKKDQSQLLQTIVELIVRESSPEQVILFGSRSTGSAREGSDYDFLVVVQGVQNEREVSRRIYRTLLETKVGAAVDVVVTSTGTLERRKKSPFFIYRQVLQEGRVLYDHRRV